MMNQTRIPARRFAPFFIAVVLTPALASPAAPQTAASSITEEEIRDHIFHLASDALEGRGTGQEGYLLAAQYAAAQLRAGMVHPMFQGTSGDAELGGGFFQPVALIRSSLGEDNRLVFTADGESTTLAHGKDYFVLTPAPGEAVTVGSELAFAGYGIRDAERGWDDLATVRLPGTLPLVMFDQPGPEVSSAFAGDETYVGWEGLGAKIEVLEELGAQAVMVVPGSQLFDNWDRMAGYFTSERMSVAGASRGGILPDADIPVFILARHVVEDLFRGQSFDPVTHQGDYGTFALSGVRAEARVQSIAQEMNAPNVVGWVEGTDPVLKDEYIVVGAHLDHLGTRNGQVYNGADDNASGSVGVMEIAEAMAMAPPKRSLVFVLFSGEEMGLLGSRFFVDNSPVPLDRIKAMVNLEMIGRWAHRPKGSGQLFGIVGTTAGTTMRDAVRTVNGHGFDYELEMPEQFMGGSDHIAFERAGIPNITFAGSPPYGTHEDYHRVGDDAEKIEIPEMRKAVAFIYDFVLELANR